MINVSMKALVVVFFQLFFQQAILAQILPEEYHSSIKLAEFLYKEGKFAESAGAYSAAFKVNGWKGLQNDRYNAACSWSLAKNADSAFYQLDRIVNMMAYVNYDQISVDKDFGNIQNDARWKPLLDLIQQNKIKEEKNYNMPLVKILDTVFKDDQESRNRIKEFQSSYGNDSKEMKALWRSIIEKDSINLIKVTAILDQHGWLGPSVIGNQGNSALFLVIQHSPIAVQLKYLPMMREAVQRGNARASSLALLEDRVALRQGKKQIYGSQISNDPISGKDYVQPLEDPDHVDERRAEVGLQPLADYVKFWNITWDVEQYKKDLPAIEAREKESKKK